MGYKDENIKHKLGVATAAKFKCPKCGNGLGIPKAIFSVICSKCEKVISHQELAIQQ